MHSRPGWPLSLALAIALSGQAHAQETPPGAAVGQLPHVARPVTYRIDLRPDLSRLTFAGNETIEVQVTTATDTLTLNALELTVMRASLSGPEPQDATVQVDKEHQTVVLHFAHPVEVGLHTLSLDFKGRVNASTQGLFYLRYGAHREHILLATDLEPSDCRRIFPGWDEPAYRARFGLSITVPNGLMGVSNMPVEKTESPAPGLHKLTFQMSPPMATYLFNVEAGDFETVSGVAAGTPIRVVTTRGKARQGVYALQVASRLLPFYNDYFGVRYPLPKLDLIALPKGDGGAMENWGAITYDESALLFDPVASPEQDRARVFGVVAHEMAHQWFGDLVTMAWWDNLWLNESFASWMALKATERFNPSWQTWVGTAEEKNQSMQSDARHSTHPIEQPVHDPSEADSVFDDITYGKGSSVIRMLESYLGPAIFQLGIQRYMQTHQFGNTTTTDLWQCLQDVSGEPVTDIARTWTEVPGFPLVAIEGTRNAELLTQERFCLMPPQTSALPWKVPLTFVALDDAGVPPSSILGDPSVPLPRQGLPYKINARGAGYYRVQYEPAQYDALLRDWARLPPSDRLEVLQDQWALVMSEKATPDSWLRLVQRLRPIEDVYLYPTVLDEFDSIDRSLSGASQVHWRQFALNQLRPLQKYVGWHVDVADPPVKMTLRAHLLWDAGRFGDAAVQREARKRFDEYVANPASLPSSLKPPVFDLVGFTADERTFDSMHQMALRETDLTQKRALYWGLCCTPDERLATRLMDLSLTSELPGDSAVRLVRYVSTWHPDMAWKFTMQHARELLAKLSVFERISYVPTVAQASTDAHRADELEAYGRLHPDNVTHLTVANAAEVIRFNDRFKRQVAPHLVSYQAASPRPGR